MSSPGNSPNLRQLFDEHAKYIWRALRHLGVPDADVEDVCQEVWVTAHRKLPEFEGRSSVRTWLYGICMRVASDYRRRAYVRRERPTAEPAPEGEPLATSEFGSRVEARRALKALLELLDEEKRAVLVLYELEGFTMKEVAEILDTPLQTAYSRLYAAREVLSAAVRGEGAE
ncbi:MAG TPA: RNA polymerase sigma factor [Polyangiaceae bacterium]|nr:RNA polymerase sigma factor [Polyangiaceae bacterium]